MPSAIYLPPFAVAHNYDALRVRVDISFDDADYCSKSRRQQCCRPYSRPLLNEGGDAQWCSARLSASPSFRSALAEFLPWCHPTSAGRSNSSAPPVRSSSSCGYSSVLPWHGPSIRLREKRMRGVREDAPRQEALARARPDYSWFRNPDTET